MVFLTILLLSLASFDLLLVKSSPHLARQSSCQPFQTTFSTQDVSRSGSSAPFVGVSPEGSYVVTEQGLELYLDRPEGPIHTKDGVNDKVGEGATVNSTFTIL